VIPAPRPDRAVRRREQRHHLVPAQGTDQFPVRPLDWDGQDLGGQADAFRRAQGDQAEERADRGQPLIARPHRTAPLAFQMVQERQHGVGIERLQAQGRRRGAGPLLHEAQQQTERVPVAVNGLRAGPLVLSQMLGEECLQVGSDKVLRGGHGTPPALGSSWKRVPARRSSVGVAVRYQ
jgi:hypothetical protein